VEDGQVTIKIADWGYAQIISDEQGYLTSRLGTSPSPPLRLLPLFCFIYITPAGTVNYMAPEIMARQVDARPPHAALANCCNNLQTLTLCKL
jgi:hypothetical protein